MLNAMINRTKALLTHIKPIDHFLKTRKQRRKFRTEIALIQGKHHNVNHHPSIIHFSVNRSATQYIKSILRSCAIENGMTPVNIHGYAFNNDFPYLDHLSAQEMQTYQHIFKSKGYLYSAFGGMIEGIAHLEQYKIILVVRDPRDILVSQYYATAHSHRLPGQLSKKREQFIARRIAAQQASIDEYTLAHSERVRLEFERYRTLLLERYPTICYQTTFEEMVVDFETWLKNLLQYCELEISQQLFQSLIEENRKMRPKEENIYAHIRKGQIGDYQEKLTPETITRLNETFASILQYYGYKRGVSE